MTTKTKTVKLGGTKAPQTVAPQHRPHTSVPDYSQVNDAPYGQTTRYKTNRGKFSVNDTERDVR